MVSIENIGHKVAILSSEQPSRFIMNHANTSNFPQSNPGILFRRRMCLKS